MDEYILLTFTAQVITYAIYAGTLRWRHKGRDGVSYHQPHACLLNRLLGGRSK